ncbi:ribosomal protein S5 domain 2-type protein [Zopfochytrium polystomum]|nr:ribosomal protein S5 domain 2-type protein [Zopfochytrium polystomum]
MHEIVDPEGLRVDGRRASELRRINCRVGAVPKADGSAYLEQGNTKCIAAIYGPKEPFRRGGQHDRASISIDINVASFSTGERKQQMKRDRRLLDMANNIKSVFEAAVMTATFPRSEICIEIQILQFDGGILHTAVNAATLALIDAGIPMFDYVAACSAAYANKCAVLDVNYLEESSDIPVSTVGILPRSGKVVLLSMESRLPMDCLEEVLSLASEGAKQTHAVLDKAIRTTSKKPRQIN